MLVVSSMTSRENKDIVYAKKPSSLQSRAGNCVRGKAEIDLDINNVRAHLLNSGDLWWDRNTARYEVPKLTTQQIQSGQRRLTPLFAGSIWISGKVAGNLRLAGLTYSTNGNQFWPGPIKQGDGAIDRSKCDKFDKFWSVKGEDIKNAEAGLAPTTAILEWPGKGNPYLIRNNIFTADELSEEMAPFNDKDNDGIYNPEVGDLPAIKSVSGASGSACANCKSPSDYTYADQMVFWVINDIGNDHSGPASTPIGIQVNCIAFAFKSSDQLNNMTFYSYQIHNKSNVDLNETYMTQFMDADLGNFNDDYVGCDTSRSLGYIYNSDDNDQTSSTQGYGENVPIFGVDFFEGPKNTNCEPIGMSSFVYLINGSGGDLNDPNTEIEFRNFQEGKTRTGKGLTVSSDCITPGGTPTKYCFYGDPSKSGEWSMCDAGFPPKDLRWLQNSGPFTMESGTNETITIGLVFVQPPAGSQKTCKPVMSYLFEADDKAQRLFEACFKRAPGPDAPELFIIESVNQLDVKIENLATSNNFGEKYNKKNVDIPITKWNKDSTYVFEGYLIYQISSENAVSNLEDIKDPSKAKLYAIMDRKNNISRAVNFTVETVNGIEVKKVNEDLTLPNTGINREFTITDDLFQQEGKAKLVNNKTYYYATIAFAFNAYKDTFPTPKDYQKNQIYYSNEIKIFKGTPHNDNFWGLNTKAKFNQGIDVKRIQGQGHGQYFLNILKTEEDKIFSTPTTRLDDLTYSGGNSPILVKVTDPYKLKNADFTLTIKDSSKTPGNDKFDKMNSYWDLEINGVSTHVASEGNIDREYNQSIYTQIGAELESYGISVGISIADSVNINARNKKGIYDYIGGSITYSDSAKKWLSFMPDVDNTEYTDWIRSGSVADASGKYQSSYNIIGGRKVYNDSTKTFEDVIGKTFAPYCLAANTNMQGVLEANTYQSFGPGFKWKRLSTDSATMSNFGEGPENNLDSIFSFDLVITNDKIKWTKGVVFETGEATQFNEFGARKGQLRKAPGVGKDGNPDGGPVGLGWFPGYAINLETGVRMNISFGENSRFRGKGGANMMWDPDSLKQTVLGSPIYGGSQFIYIMNSEYDEGAADQAILFNNFNITSGTGVNEVLSPNVAAVYRKIAWTCFPLLNSGFSFYDEAGNYRIPSDIRVKIRVQKPYARYNGSESIYTFSTQGMAPTKNDSMAKTAFDRMTVVPNPYNAYSIYESGPTQNIVKIVNVPKNSTVSIFTTDGILVRKIKLDGVNSNATIYGSSNSEVNYDNSIVWDMRTSSGILISSGTYYINVESPQFGTKVLKLFATMRAADVSNF